MSNYTMIQDMSDTDRLSLDFAMRHPDAFARALSRGEFEECEQVLAGLPADRMAGIVARLPGAQIRRLLNSSGQKPESWLAEAPFEDAVNLLSRLSRERRLVLINKLADSDRQRDLLRQQQYPAHSIGALVADIPQLLAAMTQAKDVVNDLRELNPDTIGPIVVVDIYGRYLGVLDRWRLLLSTPPTGLVDDFLIPLTPIRPETPVAVVARDDLWHHRNWLPVVDHRQRVLGIVSREKVMRAASTFAENVRPGGDILVDLLDELVALCEKALHKLAPRSGAR